MKFLILSLVITFVSFAGPGDNFNRTDCADDFVECNVSSGDVTVDPEGTRGVYVDSLGEVRIRVRPRGGNGVQKDMILTFDGAGYYAIGNIVKVYRYVTGTTPTTTKIKLAADNSAVIGVKILK